MIIRDCSSLADFGRRFSSALLPLRGIRAGLRRKEGDLSFVDSELSHIVALRGDVSRTWATLMPPALRAGAMLIRMSCRPCDPFTGLGRPVYLAFSPTL